MEKYYSDANILKGNFTHLRNNGILLKVPFNILKMSLNAFITFLAASHFIFGNKSRGYAVDFVDSCALILSGFGLHFTVINFSYRRSDILKLVDRMNIFQIFGEPQNLKETVKRINHLNIFYQASVGSGAFYYGLLDLLFKSKCQRQREIDGKEHICGIFIQVPFNEYLEKMPQNLIMFITQIISGIALVCSASAIYGFIFAINEHIILRIRLLKHNLLQLDNMDNKEDNVLRVHMKNCIVYHNSIIGFVDEVNNCFGDILFAAITIDTVAVGIITMECLLFPTLSVYLHLIAWVTTLFLLCIAGQRLFNEGVSLEECVSKLEWYKHPVWLQKELLFIKMRSQKTLVLKAGKFGTMSFETFVKVMKTSYSYVAVLQQSMADN